MTEKLTALVMDAKTGIAVERELTKEELDELEQIKIEEAQLTAETEAKVAARESALAKLAALGLTEAEIAAL